MHLLMIRCSDDGYRPEHSWQPIQRMTTMEAANESARHAVNAILRTIAKIDADQAPIVFNGQGRLIGEFCQIWNPEEHELADLLPLKKIG